MYKEFMVNLDRVKYNDFYIDESPRKQIESIEPLLTELLNGKIQQEREDFSYVIRGSDETIPLIISSSSVKELFPLYLLIKSTYFKQIFLSFEEPEAHLHPQLQYNIAQLLVYMVNKGSFIQVTTHSDFFVNQINNLLKLNYIKENKQDQFKDILEKTGIPEHFMLAPSTISSYVFKSETKGVKAIKQDISPNGIPMDSFEKIYEESVSQTRKLRRALADDDD